MSSVLFLDIVGYSKKSVSAQISTKEAFNAMLANAIQNVPADDRVILDTGDGAAVTFLGDVEDALKSVLVFRESLLNEGTNMEPPLEVCMGINIGPVRLVKDINGRANIVGEGINVAQRIMGFAKPGQILVSRSYFDATSRLQQEYAGMFFHEGTRADKHGREHEIYAIGKPGEAGAVQEAGENTLGLAVKQQSPALSAEVGIQGALATFQNASGQQRALYIGIIVTALALIIVVAMKIMHRSEPPPPPVAVEAQTAPVEASAVPEIVSAPPPTEIVAAEPTVTTSSHDAEAPPPMTETMTPQKPKVSRAADAAVNKAKETKTSRAQQEPVAKPTPSAAAEVKPAGPMASVSIAVAPWGEVYVDGKKQGVSPPLETLSITPGKHEIEIRNTTFTPYTLSVQVSADEQLKIKHKFTN